MVTTSMNPEILIIGGGVIGLSIARELDRRGLSGIAVVEQGYCGEQSSWAAAGMLGAQAETDEPGDMLSFCVESRSMYPDLAASLLEETGVDIELDQCGTLYLAFDDGDASRISERVRWQRNAGLEAVTLSGAETRRTEPFVSPEVIGGALFPNDWQVDNRKLLSALRRYADLRGISVVEQTTVNSLKINNGVVTGAITSGGEISASKTLLATGAWTSLIKIGAFPVPIAVKPIRGQMIAFRTAKRLFERVVYSTSGYMVPRADGRVLIGATSEDVGFNKDISAIATAGLIETASKIAPALSSLPVIEEWAGLRPAGPDQMPILGEFSGVQGLYVATSHYRNGILLAPRTAELIADLMIDERRSPYLEAFGPDRFRIK